MASIDVLAAGGLVAGCSPTGSRASSLCSTASSEGAVGHSEAACAGREGSRGRPLAAAAVSANASDSLHSLASAAPVDVQLLGRPAYDFRAPAAVMDIGVALHDCDTILGRDDEVSWAPPLRSIPDCCPAVAAVATPTPQHILRRVPTPSSPATPQKPSSSPVANGGGGASKALHQTTLMLRNLSEDVTKDILLKELKKSGMEAAVDFVHVCMDFKRKTCTGEAYINFMDAFDARALHNLWQGRTDLAGCLGNGGTRRGQLSIVFSRKQGFDACVTENYRKHVKDSRLKAWVHPAKEACRRALEQAKDGYVAAGLGEQMKAAAELKMPEICCQLSPTAPIRPPPGLEAFGPGKVFHF